VTSVKFLRHPLLEESMMSDREFVAGQSGAPGGDLSGHIERFRNQVADYLTHARARQRRLINLAIIAGAVATVLTASPALGGVSFSNWLNETFGFSSPAWQVLCAGAAVCSLAAAISTQLLKSHNLDEHVARAEAVRAKLEALDLGRITGRLTQEQVATEYSACIEQASFL
jgi:hypothetical protein